MEFNMVRYNFVNLETRQPVSLTSWDKSAARTKCVRFQVNGRIATMVIYIWNKLRLVSVVDYTQFVGEI